MGWILSGRSEDNLHLYHCRTPGDFQPSYAPAASWVRLHQISVVYMTWHAETILMLR